jgi:hypothetical protein
MRAHYALLGICVFVCLTTGVAFADNLDTTPPAIVALAVSPNPIWPPNHKMVAVTIDALVIDDTDPAPLVHIIGVTSNDPTVTSADYEITGELSLNVRADKNGNGPRVYTVIVEATDASGNTAVGTIDVTIGHTGGHQTPF